MENMGIRELAKELKKLNPYIGISIRAELYPGVIVADCPDCTELNFPDGYYYNGKNGLTNKHHTASGQYEFFELMTMFDYMSLLA